MLSRASIVRHVIILSVLLIPTIGCPFQILTNNPGAEPTDATEVPTVTPNPTREAYMQGFAGSWDTNWGNMTCSVAGESVHCEYSHDQGRIDATLSLDEQTMDGQWAEAPSYSPPKDGGKVTFSLSEDRSKIYGHWWYGQNEDGGSWTGTRK